MPKKNKKQHEPKPAAGAIKPPEVERLENVPTKDTSEAKSTEERTETKSAEKPPSEPVSTKDMSEDKSSETVRVVESKLLSTATSKYRKHTFPQYEAYKSGSPRLKAASLNEFMATREPIEMVVEYNAETKDSDTLVLSKTHYMRSCRLPMPNNTYNCYNAQAVGRQAHESWSSICCDKGNSWLMVYNGPADRAGSEMRMLVEGVIFMQSAH
jgi:hypothetical protein